jgi:tRNA-specific 2-thiouridylase
VSVFARAGAAAAGPSAAATTPQPPATAAREEVIVALSGGVDSAVAAWLLRRQGHRVRAAFMKNWEEDDRPGECSAARDVADALAVCQVLELGLDRVSFATEYWERVFERFLADHRAGLTPNPDVLCNREIKFRAFLDYARGRGAGRIATGHYARVERVAGRYRLLQGVDRDKDQSYFLYTLDQDALARSLFPVGHLTKAQVRRIAADAGLPNHARKGSTGICFIGERPYRPFLERFLPPRPGDICTVDGVRVGTHRGLAGYTLGQRRGLGIGGRAGALPAPWFVLAKDLERNVLVVAQGHDHPALLSRGLVAREAHWVSGHAPSRTFACAAKVRYRQPPQACRVTPTDAGGCRVEFAEPQRAVTPGQSVVFYAGEECLGGAVIEGVVPLQPVPGHLAAAH